MDGYTLLSNRSRSCFLFSSPGPAGVSSSVSPRYTLSVPRDLRYSSAAWCNTKMVGMPTDCGFVLRSNSRPARKYSAPCCCRRMAGGGYISASHTVQRISKRAPIISAYRSSSSLSCPINSPGQSSSGHPVPSSSVRSFLVLSFCFSLLALNRAIFATCFCAVADIRAQSLAACRMTSSICLYARASSSVQLRYCCSSLAVSSQ